MNKQLKILHEINGIEKLKVAAYARISRDKADLENSLETQIRYYTTLIRDNPSWEFAGIYADDGISGGQIKKRNQFRLMITKAFAGQIDVILVKSISRFARNTVDLLSTIQELRSSGIEVYFEKEEISSFDTASDSYLGMYARFAEDELTSISNNVKWSKEKIMAKGRFYFDAGRMFGFKFDDDRKAIINEKEAYWVRKIFSMYLEGYNSALIADFLEQNNVKTSTGNDRWSSCSIRKLIRNEKYCGDVILQKRYSESPITKRMITNNGQKDKYYLEGALPAIVSKEIWNACQSKMDENVKRFKITHESHKANENSYTRFGYCPYCQNTYYRKLNHGKELLYCYSNKNRMICKDSESVYIAHLDKIIPLLVKKLKANEYELRKELISAYEESDITAIDTKISNLNEELQLLRDKKSEYDNLTGEAFDALRIQFKKEIDRITNELLILENEKATTINPSCIADSIINELRAFPDDESIGNYDFRKLFKRLVVINRDRLVFVIGSDDLSKLPLNPNAISMGFVESYDYVIRSSSFRCLFGIYINK